MNLHFLLRTTKLLLPRHHPVSFVVTAAMLLMLVATASGTMIVAPAKAHAQSDDACNCVIFRLDDIQDAWITQVQSAVIDKFIERNEDLNLAIIMNDIGNDPVIVNKVKDSIATGLIEPTLHGWDHVDYTTLSLKNQQKTIEMANQKMEDLFGTKSETFVAPYNAYDENTLKALNKAGLKILSAEFDQEIPSIYNPDEPDSPDNKVYKAIAGSDITDSQGIYHLPQVIGFYTYDSDPPTKTPLSLIKSQIDKTIASYGYAVVTLHPQDFTVKDASNNPTEELSKKEIKDLDALITWVNDQGYHIGKFSTTVNSETPSSARDENNSDNDNRNNDGNAASDIIAPLLNTIAPLLKPNLGDTTQVQATILHK
ncbi:MAG TPA: polysaccharide deacetylase family protein [Nitrososphaera sp.]|nr:polysaccharide deacetylase family protein [Nitrososphaera sp.]